MDTTTCADALIASFEQHLRQPAGHFRFYDGNTQVGPVEYRKAHQLEVHGGWTFYFLVNHQGKAFTYDKVTLALDGHLQLLVKFYEQRRVLKYSYARIVWPLTPEDLNGHGL